MNTDTATDPATVPMVRLARARVTHIAVSRLFNLGNYQNVRYDVGVDVPAEANAEDIFRELRYILAALKPIPQPSCLDEFRRAIKKPESERSNYEKENFEAWTETIAAWELRKKTRNEAIKALDSLGGHSEFRDAKESWSDDPEDELF